MKNIRNINKLLQFTSQLQKIVKKKKKKIMTHKIFTRLLKYIYFLKWFCKTNELQNGLRYLYIAFRYN